MPWEDESQLGKWLVEECDIGAIDAVAYAYQFVQAGFDSPRALTTARIEDWPAIMKVGHQRAIQHVAAGDP